MLKLFRRIRRNLLDEGNLKKYIIYAIGEIFLVMVGILLALQVNNWNEGNKIHKKEKNYLNSLHDQFTLNLGELRRSDSLIIIQLTAAKEILKHCSPDQKQFDKSLFTSLYHQAFKDLHKFLPTTGIIQEIINSGDISIFSNAKLRMKISSWHSKLSQVREQESESRSAIYAIQNFMRDNGNFRTQINDTSSSLNLGETTFESNNANLLSNEQFESHVSLFIGINNSLLNNYYPIIRKEIKEIIEIVESENM